MDLVQLNLPVIKSLISPWKPGCTYRETRGNLNILVVPQVFKQKKVGLCIL